MLGGRGEEVYRLLGSSFLRDNEVGFFSRVYRFVLMFFFSFCLFLRVFISRCRSRLLSLLSLKSLSYFCFRSVFSLLPFHVSSRPRCHRRAHHVVLVFAHRSSFSSSWVR